MVKHQKFRGKAFATIKLMSVAAIAVFAVPSLAQKASEPKTQEGVEIRSSKKIPLAVKAKMPRNGKTRFYGVIPKIGPQKHDVLLHFYSEPVKDKKILAENPEAVTCTVNLFAASGTKRSPKAQLLNSLHFYNWSKMVWEGNEVSASLFWLVPKTKQTPVVNITLSSGGAMYGNWRHEVLLVFRQGLQKAPLEETGFSGAYSDGSEYFGCGELDKTGTMQITLSRSTRVVVDGDYTSEVSGEVLHWNGKEFR